MKHAKSGKSELEKRLEAEAAAELAEQPPLAGASGEAPSSEPAGVDVAALAAERDELKDLLLRSRAEFDNYRKRIVREYEQTRKLAAESVIRELLPVVDNLERALEHVDDPSSGLAQGVEMVVKQLRTMLSQNGVEPIPAIGAPFDPNVHEAMMRMPSHKYPADVVVQEFLRGYKLGDFVLRPAKVVVSSGGPPGQTPVTVRAGEEMQAVSQAGEE